MPSPFPGMDPYLESPALWSDFHLTMTVAIRGALNARLPTGYVAAVDRYVSIHEPEVADRKRTLRPNVYVSSREELPGSPVGAKTLAPTAVVLPAQRREGNKYVKIIDAHSRRVVTVIELLSPANKTPGPDRQAYLTKRIDYLDAGVNVVEIDLLRGGARLPLGDPPPSETHYYVLVCRALSVPNAGVWPFSMRDPLPVVPVPLDPGEKDVMLSLRDCLERAYAEGRYAEQIDYSTPPPPPPLDEATAEWTRQIVAGAGKT